MKLKLLALITLFLACDLAFAQRQWEQTSGPEGGFVWSIVTAPNGNLYSATGSGVFRSEDNGNSWLKLNGSPFSYSQGEMYKLAVNTDGNIYALTSRGLYRSTDSGITWGLIFNNGSQILISPDGDIFIGGSSIYISLDDGETWQMQNEIITNDLVINSQGHLLAVVDYNQLHISTDNGITWNYLSTPAEGFYIRSIAVNSRDELFIATDFEVIRSLDNGLTWEPVLDASYAGKLAINSNDDVFFAHFDDGIFRSFDNGETWDILNEGMTDRNVWAVAFDSANNIYAGTRRGIFKSSNNGDNWELSVNGLNSNSIYSLEVNESGDVFAAAAMELFRSIDKGDNWSIIYQTEFDIIQDLQIRENGDIYLTAFDFTCSDCPFGDEYVVRSRDNGETWNEIFRMDGNIECVSFIEDTIYISGESSLFISFDNGETFNKQPDTVKFYCNTIILTSGISYRPNYVEINGSWKSTIEKSTDNGSAWEPTLIWDEPPANYIKLRSNSDNHVFAFTYALIVRSIDNGITWDTIFNAENVIEMLIDNENRIYVATDVGVFLSVDNGDNWTEINEGIEITYIVDIAIDSSGILYTTPSSAGVWKYDLMVNSKSITTNHKINIYPNPSGSFVTINLPDSIQTLNKAILIYNIQGKLVKHSPIQGNSTTIDVSGLPKGIYILTFSGKSLMQKLIVH